MSDAPKFAVRLQRTVPSRRRRRASQRLAVKLGTKPERIRSLIARPPSLITKPIEHADARQILRDFVNEGIEVELIRITPDLGPDVFKTSTNLRLTSIIHRGSESPDQEWPDARTWDESQPQDVDKVYAVRLIVRVPAQRIEALVRRLSDRLEVDERRLRKLLSRPPGLLSKPVRRATSERITSILSAEGVVVESVRLLDEAEGGPGSLDFDLRLTLDSALMQAHFGNLPSEREAVAREKLPEPAKMSEEVSVAEEPSESLGDRPAGDIAPLVSGDGDEPRPAPTQPPNRLSTEAKPPPGEVAPNRSARDQTHTMVPAVESKLPPPIATIELEIEPSSAKAEPAPASLRATAAPVAGEVGSQKEAEAAQAAAAIPSSDSSLAALALPAAAPPEALPVPEIAEGESEIEAEAERTAVEPPASLPEPSQSQTPLLPAGAKTTHSAGPQGVTTDSPVEGSLPASAEQPTVAKTPKVEPPADRPSAAAEISLEAESATTVPARGVAPETPLRKPRDQAEKKLQSPSATVLETDKAAPATEPAAAQERSEKLPSALASLGEPGLEASPDKAPATSRTSKKAKTVSPPATTKPAASSKPRSKAKRSPPAAAAAEPTPESAAGRRKSAAQKSTDRPAATSTRSDKSAPTSRAAADKKKRTGEETGLDATVPKMKGNLTAEALEPKQPASPSTPARSGQTDRAKETKAQQDNVVQTKPPKRRQRKQPARSKTARSVAAETKKLLPRNEPVEPKPVPSIAADSDTQGSPHEPAKPNIETRVPDAAAPAAIDAKAPGDAPAPSQEVAQKGLGRGARGRQGRQEPASGRKRKAPKSVRGESPEPVNTPPEGKPRSRERTKPDLPPPLDPPGTPPLAGPAPFATEGAAATVAVTRVSNPTVAGGVFGSMVRVEMPAPTATQPRPAAEPVVRGLLTLLALDIGVLAVLARSGNLLTSPVGVTLLLLFSLLLIGQAMLTRERRSISNLFTALAVVPLIFMFPALIDTLSPWRELGATYQLIVISLLLLVSSLSVASSLGLDLLQLGMGLGRKLATPLATPVEASVWLQGAILRPIRDLLIQLAIAASGLLLGSVGLRYLEPPAGVSNLLSGAGWLVVIGLLLAAVAQEFFFRGLLQRLAGAVLGVPLGIVASALLFALLFSTSPFSGSMLFTLLLALVSGIVAYLTGSVVGLSLAQTLALLVYLGFMGDPLLCFQGGFDGSCLASAWGGFLEGLR